MKGRLYALLFLLLSVFSAAGDIRLTEPGQPVVIGGKGVVLTVPAYDADAIAYFLRAGVTDATAKQQISDFVKGVKALGLWSNMVCWPMRSAQNAGTGTTVYSLGGLGTYNGTMVNGPTWGTDGITTNATSHYILIPNLTLPSNTGFIFAVNKPASVAAQHQIIRVNGTGKILNMYAPFSDGTVYTDLGNSGGARLSAAGLVSNNQTFSLFGGSAAGSGIVQALNGAQTASGGTSALAGTYDSGANTIIGNGTSTGNGVRAIVAFCSGAYASPQVFHDLYKSTLGQGLGLP